MRLQRYYFFQIYGRILAHTRINGSVPLNFITDNPRVENILRYIADRENLPEIDTHITAEQVAKGIRRWRETTSTSPSGCHLRLRRITTYPSNDVILEEACDDILQAQADIINIPIQNGFSPT
jgi:hypothetical protein